MIDHTQGGRTPSGIYPLLIALLAVAGGCTQVEYQIVQPPALAQTIGDKTATLRRNPMEYRFTSVEDHLVIRAYNRSAQPITLLGGFSTIVDPQGLVHPLSSRLIQPQSFVKLILPPVRPIRVEGAPLGMSRIYYGPEFYDSDPFWDGPPYYPDPFFDSPPAVAYEDSLATYWRWDHGDVRLDLVYLSGMHMPFGPASAPTTSAATQPAAAMELPPGAFKQEFVFRVQNR